MGKTAASVVGVVGITLLATAVGQCKQRDVHPDATVFLHVDTMAAPGVLERARQLATSMFATIGVNISWRLFSHGHEPELADGLPLSVLITSEGPPDDNSDALASARPFAGTSRGIIIRYDRIHATAGSSRDLEGMILAHVLVHEITHVLQCLDRHSDTGIMKARWTVDDYVEMRWRPLDFTPEDIQLIFLGLRTVQERPQGPQLAFKR